MKEKIEVIQGDITTLAIDAIVNAGKESLLGGGGVDGAIHNAAGDELYHFCYNMPHVDDVRCPTGEARLTPGFNLPAEFIIHTVGPVWQAGTDNEAEKLANCYRNCMELAAMYGIKTIAFPAISTGVYSYPMEEATKIAYETVFACLDAFPSIEKVIFCCFSEEDKEIYEQVVKENE